MRNQVLVTRAIDEELLEGGGLQRLGAGVRVGDLHPPKMLRYG